MGGTKPPLCHFSDRPHVVIETADIVVEFLTLRHEHVLDPSVESLGTIDDTKHEKLSAFGHVVLLPLLCNDHSNCCHECTEDLNTIHESVVVFLIINLGHHLQECISGRERFGQFHVVLCVASLCREFLNHETTIPHRQGQWGNRCAVHGLAQGPRILQGFSTTRTS